LGHEVRNTEPAAGTFEFNNEFYPDTDDTARCCSRSTRWTIPRAYQHEVAERAIAWEFAMQCKTAAGQLRQRQHQMIFQYILLRITTPCSIRPLWTLLDAC